MRSSDGYSLHKPEEMTIEEETKAETRGIRGDYLVVFQAVLLPVTCGITYLIATLNNHVESQLPFISETGTWPPESCVFGLLLCFYVMSTLITVHIRWALLNRHASSFCRRLNLGGLVTGMLASLGVLIVATFQMTSQLIVHLVGALMAFGLACVYMIIQSMLSWRLPTLPGYVWAVVLLRIILVVFTFFSIVFTAAFTWVSTGLYRGNDTKTHDPGSGKWNSTLGGNDFHLVATSSEWALAILVSIFFLTFFREFSHIRFGMPKVYWTSVAGGNGDGIENPAMGQPRLVKC